ncbi:MAG: hypothetical protein JWM68_5330, partial [Verrucomicrobiales bacterium]|nr:hypothetical protein [Verrucomicrobiales bacterium]
TPKARNLALKVRSGRTRKFQVSCQNSGGTGLAVTERGAAIRRNIRTHFLTADSTRERCINSLVLTDTDKAVVTRLC